MLAAFIIFRLSIAATDTVIDTGYVRQHFSERKEAADMENLQELAGKTNLSGGSSQQLDAWAESHTYLYFLIDKGGKIVYSSDSGFTSGIAKNLSYYSFDEDMSSYSRYRINFSDGDYDVYVMSFYSNQLYNYTFVLSIILGVTAFMLLFTALIIRKVRYIDHLSHDIEILEGGNLEYEVPVKGKDELASLAESLNAMRITLARQNEAETQQKKNSNELVTALSHDLRTPLTAQLGYLEIIREMPETENDGKMSDYLDKCITNCHQIKDMSDRLFEYFLACSRNTFDDPVELEEFDGAGALMQLISENTAVLEESGFSFKTSVPDEKFMLRLNIGYMCRVFDNIFSNIRKYADRQYPVSIRVSCDEEECTAVFENHIAKNAVHTESTKIGLMSIDGLMRAQNGLGMSSSGGDVFRVRLTFPK